MNEFEHFRRRRQANLVIAVTLGSYAALCLVSTTMHLMHL